MFVKFHKICLGLDKLPKCIRKVLESTNFKKIDLGIKRDNNKYNQKLPHIYVMTKWIANNYFLSKNLYIRLSLARSRYQ